MKRLIRSFDRAGVRYLIVGGQAAILHGAADFSEDVDLWIRPDRANIERALGALAGLRARIHKLTPPLTRTHVAAGHGFHFRIPARMDDGGGAAVPGGHIPGLTLPQGPATLSVRPEDIALTDPAAAPMQGEVTFVRDLGATIEVFIDCEGTEIIAVETPRARRAVETGTRVGVAISPDRCVVLGS